MQPRSRSGVDASTKRIGGVMSRTLTLEQVLEAEKPAYTEGLLYRYLPRQGFQRAGMVRFAPDWLAIPWPAQTDLAWYHEDGCDCGCCQPATEVRVAPREQVMLAAR